MKKEIGIILGVLLCISILFNVVQRINIGYLEERLGKRSEPQAPIEEKVSPNIAQHSESGKRTGHSSPSDAGLVKGLGKNIFSTELSRWQSIGLVTNYEISGGNAVVYVNHSDWISLQSSNKADFKAGIRSKWPDGSVIFRDSETGERL